MAFYRDCWNEVPFFAAGDGVLDCGGVRLMMSLPEQRERIPAAKVRIDHLPHGGRSSGARSVERAASAFRAAAARWRACRTRISGWRSSAIRTATCSRS
jgi:hypothetical protein